MTEHFSEKVTLKGLASPKPKGKRISEECKYFKDCLTNWECLYEIALYGSALWSVEICYDLHNLEQSGFIKVAGNRIEERIAYGMIMLGKHKHKIVTKQKD